MNKTTINTECKSYAILAALMAGLVMSFLSGCSYKTEIGWHGTTGRDDRTMTPQFIPAYNASFKDTLGQNDRRYK